MTFSATMVSWQAAALTLATLVVCSVLRLLTEWQRRETFKALTVGAPEGTVVTQYDGPEGQSMRAAVGSPLPRQPSAWS